MIFRLNCSSAAARLRPRNPGPRCPIKAPGKGVALALLLVLRRILGALNVRICTLLRARGGGRRTLEARLAQTTPEQKSEPVLVLPFAKPLHIEDAGEVV